jgi:hypothetical protein
MIYRPYTNNNAVQGNSLGPIQDQPFPSTSLLGAFVSRLPYAYSIIDSILDRNPKFKEFKNVEPKRDELIQGESVFLNEPSFQQGYGAPGSVVINKDYQAFIYASIDKDKTQRLSDYRRMAAYAELSNCIDEICDECLVKDENDNIITFNLRGEFSKEIKDTVEKEFKKFITIFDLEDRGWEYFRQFLIDGELFFENILDADRKDLGIVGVVSLPAELINPVYHNIQNELIKGFIIRKPVTGPTSSIDKKDQEEVFFMNKAQVTYIHSNIWNEFKNIRLPYIQSATRAYRQLSLIEDSVVIYRLVRAPERLKFKVYTGNMPAPKAEAYLKRLMQSYWTKKNYDTQQGGGKMTNVYDPQSMLDAYWFTKDAQGNGTDVETLPAGGNLGEIKDLDYFLKKLYESLKVPISRFLTSDTPFKDGAEITRDELRFAKFIMRIQRQVAMGIRDAFISHLKIKGLWKQFKLKQRAIQLEFNIPTTFMAMRDQQLLDMKFDNFLKITGNNSISTSYAQKYFLGMTDDLMKENRAWLEKDAALRWELQQIEGQGPNWREKIAIETGTAGTGGEESPTPEIGGGSTGGGGGTEEIPAFGGSAPVGETTPEAETPGTETTGTETPTPGPETSATSTETPPPA